MRVVCGCFLMTAWIVCLEFRRGVSTKAHCYRSNANRSPQPWCGKKELYSGEQFAIQGNALPKAKGGLLSERTFYPDPGLVHFYANEKSKFAVWLIWIALSWLVSICAKEDRAAQFQLNGAGLSPLVERWLLCKVQFRCQEHSAEGLETQFVAFPWNAVCGLCQQWLLDSGYDLGTLLATRSPWQSCKVHRGHSLL